jgi:hypothetical protein
MVNQEPTPTTTETIDVSRVLPYLERIGITKEELVSEDFNETIIASKVLSNPAFTEEFSKKVKTEHDSFLTSKLKKHISSLTGIDEKDVESEVDFKKILMKGLDKVNASKQPDIENISQTYREKELALISEIESLKNAITEKETGYQKELQQYKINHKVKSFIDASPLTVTAQANKNEILEAAMFHISKKFDIREKDGVMVLYNGSQPVYKPNSSKPTLLEDELQSYIERMGYVSKKEEVKTITTPSSGNTTISSRVGYFRRK